MDREFCTVKGHPRVDSPERMLEAIRLLVETKGAKHFFVIDDLFGQDREGTLHFCKILKQYQDETSRRLDFVVQIRLAVSVQQFI